MGSPEHQPTPQEMSIKDLVNKQHLELVVEVRALAQAVAQLHTIFVKRRVLYWVLGIETVLVAAALAFLGVFVAIENSHQNTLVNRLTDTCRTRNAQIDATRTFLAREQTIQAESARLTADYLKGLRLIPSKADQALAAKIQAEQFQALSDWKDGQPADVPCSTYGRG